MMAQDTGGAIRGPVRADFFWGFGDEAGREAGRMRQHGRMWLLWPNGATPPRAGVASRDRDRARAVHQSAARTSSACWSA